MTATAPAPVGPAPGSQSLEAPSLPMSGRPWWITVLNAVPNLVVFSMLGVVMYVGHHTDWKLPTMSALMGTAPVAADDWCAEHLVPESVCIECHPELLPKPKLNGFCREHGVAECVIHHPELAQVKGEPRLPKYNTAEAIALMARPENNSRNTLHTNRVQFSSAESVDKAGIDVDLVQERLMADVITANGELMFDPTRVGHLSTRVPGSVAAVFKTVGDEIAAGDVLALVDASQVGQAKSQFLQAVVQHQLRESTVERLRPIANSGALPQKALIEAESALQEAEVALIASRQSLANLGFDLPEDLEDRAPRSLADELRFLGIPTDALALLPAGTKTANLIPVRSTYDGVLMAAHVVAGEVVDISRTLFTVSDPRRMWLILNVRQEDARYVRRGQTVKFHSDNGDRDVIGQVSWISPAIDEQTRTMQVRIIIANEDLTMHDMTFGEGQIVLREEPNAIVVPREAVQSTPDASFVFVRDKNYFEEGSPKFFYVRQVRQGARDGKYIELLAGVLPGEVVASKGSNVLLAQLLRGNLGAGCGCHDD
ncbi:MAG: efflux RND transporter periplasmic adaptor subunit [Planctomycetes bacterium]|nr:efflux RND transporter periplasmic adaptor subunit [Planctomycetota bacterium]